MEPGSGSPWLDLMLPAAESSATGGGDLAGPGGGGGGVRRRVRGGGDMERSAAVFGDGSGAATT